MDIKIDDSNGQFLEYNTIGGIIDLYFVAGPTPVEAARQYSEVVGKAVMMPYWGFGFHQCRYGMRDVYEVAEVVANYSQAGIPLETMWTDSECFRVQLLPSVLTLLTQTVVDYMYQRWVFTLDPERFPLEVVRDLVDTLHRNDQHYIVMVDPAVAYAPDSDYEAFDKGVDIFLKYDNGSLYRGVVWPGQTVYPSWFNSKTQDYWNEEFLTFFDAETGVDIDALWIDMNEASNFCEWPCLDPTAEAASQGLPPKPPAIRLGAPRPIPGFSDNFQPQCKAVVTFNVNATTFQGENIIILGSSITLGNDNIVNAAPLSANTYPIWSAAIDMPANSTFTYQYVRSQPDGTFIYENTNRTVTTESCDSTGSTQDSIRTSSPPQNKFKRQAKLARPSAPLQKRQAGGEGVGLPGRDLLNPAYAIQNDAASGVISDRTIRTDLIHEGGYAEYDTHNLYGAMMSEASRIAMLARRSSLRPLIITRSTFAGSGRQVGHWLGDNGAEWSMYLTSISQLLDFSALFGFSFVGSDVCGFSGETNENTCARWASLGAFSTFYRNHREVNFTPHEFYRSPLVAESARNAIATRYKLLDYIYTAMHEQTQSGTPMLQPMFFAYPSDPKTNSLEHQYFYGPGLLVAPVTEENSTTASFYLPDDIFYDYYTHETVRGAGEVISVTDVPYTSIPLYYKGGSIIALRANSANTTTLLRKENFQIIIAPGLDGKASGSLYLDDGVSLEQEATSNIKFSYDYESSQFKMGGTFGYDAGVIIESITVLGRAGGPASLVPITAPLTGPATLEV
jgi:alpha-glucosidase